MSGLLPPKPKIDLSQYLNNDGKLKKPAISQQLASQSECRENLMVSAPVSKLFPSQIRRNSVRRKELPDPAPDTASEVLAYTSNLTLNAKQNSSNSASNLASNSASNMLPKPKPSKAFASDSALASKPVESTLVSNVLKSYDPQYNSERSTEHSSRFGSGRSSGRSSMDFVSSRSPVRYESRTPVRSPVRYDTHELWSPTGSDSVHEESQRSPLRDLRGTPVRDSAVQLSPERTKPARPAKPSLTSKPVLSVNPVRSNSVSFGLLGPTSDPAPESEFESNSARSNSVPFHTVPSNSGSGLPGSMFPESHTDAVRHGVHSASAQLEPRSNSVPFHSVPSVSVPSVSAPSVSVPPPSVSSDSELSRRSKSLQFGVPASANLSPPRPAPSEAASGTSPVKPVPPPLPYRQLNPEMLSPSSPRLQRSVSQSSVSPDKGGRTYAPKPINESVPLKSHQADHRPPSQVPTNFLKAKTQKLLAANDRYICVTTSSKTQLYSWRTSSLVWELKGASVAAAFVPETDTVWISPTSTTGKIYIVSLTTGKTVLDLGRGHMKPVTFLATTHYGIVSLSSDDGKVNVWEPASDGLPIITQRIPIKSALASSGGIGSSILWTCRDHQVSAYKPSSSPLPFVSVSLPRRGARLGAITSIASFGDMAFFGQNDGFITTFKGATQLGVINGGIYSITALTAPSSTELWAGTRSGDILIFALHTHLQENSIQLSATLLRQWRAHSSPIVQILLADDKAAVLSTDRQGVVCCWNSTPTDVLAWSPSPSQGYLVQVLTWNIGASTPQQAHPSWFLDPDTHNADMVVIGLQEVLDLESTSQNALKLLSNGDALPDGEHHKWKQYLEMLFIPHGFSLVVMKPLVGLMACLFVKRHLVDKLSDLSTQVVRTGIHGAYGNKGGVVLSFKMAGMTWCFANCHLAAGHSAFMQRNRDASQILNTPKPLQSDVCFFFGDTNYRINAAREQAEQLIKVNNWDQLRKHDQLLSQILQLPSFCLGRFQEGDLNFAPTYKYDPGTSRYDTSDKQRIPSWCDRILYRGKSIQVTSYTDVDTTSSDHKAVRGTFKVPQLYQHA